MTKHAAGLSKEVNPSSSSDAAVGFAPAALDRETAVGSEFHQRMVEISMPRTSLRFSLRDKISRRGLHKMFHIFVRHHGLTRLRNFVRYLFQREKKSEISYMPPLINLDLNNRCNLRCPGCATGLKKGLPKKTADLALARNVIDQVQDTALQVGFFHWGEPLLNAPTYDAIEYAEGKGLWTMVSSNLSFKLDKFMDRIFDSGLHDIVISCDGVTQDVYEIYRVGGDVDLVFDNLRAIRKRRDELGRSTPYLRAKMIIFEHNWHQIEAFRDRALECGADEVSYAFGYGGESYETGVNGGGNYFDINTLSSVAKEPEGPCTEVWKEMFFTPDGGVFSCCLGYREEDLFADAAKDSQVDVASTWNNGRYKAGRRFFLGEDTYDDLPGGCQTCRFVQNSSVMEQVNKRLSEQDVELIEEPQSLVGEEAQPEPSAKEN